MDDSLQIDRKKPSTIQSLLQSRAPAAAPELEPGEAEPLDTLPTPGSHYRAHARPGNKPLTTLHFLLRDGTIRSFQYGDLDSDSQFLPASEEGGGNALLLRFRGSSVIDVRIEGRRLRTLYDYITQHRMGWVAELPQARDFEEESATVVGRIAIQLAGVLR